MKNYFLFIIFYCLVIYSTQAQDKFPRQVISEFMKIAALAGEGHTKVLPSDQNFHALAITLYHFNKT